MKVIEILVSFTILRIIGEKSMKFGILKKNNEESVHSTKEIKREEVS